MWHDYLIATSIEEVLSTLSERQEKARIIAGSTDLILEMERGVRKGIETLIDITRISGLSDIRLDENNIVHLGPLVTHNDVVGSKILREVAYPLVQAAWEVGSPQIRNRGTIAGNLITASPANDTITPLMALGTRLTLKSLKGERQVSLEEFYLGVRRTIMHPDEMLVDISFPVMDRFKKGTFIKFALRRAQAISLANIAIVLSFDHHAVSSAAITLGSVAPTIVHASKAEAYLSGKELTEDTIFQAALLAQEAATPIDDVRSSADYRRNMIRVVTRRGLNSLAKGTGISSLPDNPVLLSTRDSSSKEPIYTTWIDDHSPIETTINGKRRVFTSGHHKSLLRFLREEAGLPGTKEGCAEGECGACTVFLDGEAVMSCMVLAPRAQGAEIETIEGVSEDGQLHPVQQSFIDAGAVQCGYCTPGFIMSAVKLLDERSSPTQLEIRQALTGNLCRCTGYYKIIEAIEHASRR